MIFLIFLLLIISYICYYYKKIQINKKISINNNKYIQLFDNILSIINSQNNNFKNIEFLNLSNNYYINNYAKIYKLKLKKELSNNTIIYIENKDLLYKYYDILFKFKNIIIISTQEIKIYSYKLNLNNEYYINFNI